MPELDPQAAKNFAVNVIEVLRARGFDAYWAGGCVRDQLLGRTPKDYDVATNAKPDQIRDVFGRRRTIPVGAAFGVITVLGPIKEAGQIEVATFRQDAAYSDGRHPDSVRFSTPEADAQRRDFTINGLFFDPVAGQVIDFVDGQKDLERRLIRAIGNPAERIAEDKLRMLRALRFAAKFDFDLEPATRAAITAMAGEISVVSAERIAAEMRAMLEHASRAKAISLLSEVGLLSEILPEVSPQQVDAWNATIQALNQLGEASFPLALAVLVHRFTGESGVVALGARWKLANREIDRAAWLINHQSALTDARSQPWPRLQRILIEPGIEDLLALHAAIHHDSPTLCENQSFCQAKLALPAPELNPPPLITGEDLKTHGIPPGKIYQRMLETVRNAQLDGQISTIKEAIAPVKQIAGERSSEK